MLARPGQTRTQLELKQMSQYVVQQQSRNDVCMTQTCRSLQKSCSADVIDRHADKHTHTHKHPVCVLHGCAADKIVISITE